MFVLLHFYAAKQSGLNPESIAVASGLSNFARIVAGIFGASITTTLWENRAALHLAQLVESIGGASLSPNHLARSPPLE